MILSPHLIALIIWIPCPYLINQCTAYSPSQLCSSLTYNITHGSYLPPASAAFLIAERAFIGPRSFFLMLSTCKWISSYYSKMKRPYQRQTSHRVAVHVVMPTFELFPIPFWVGSKRLGNASAYEGPQTWNYHYT